MSSAISSWQELLAEQGLSHLCSVVNGLSLEECVIQATSERVLFLQHLKSVGVAKLSERQKLANACGQVQRMGRLGGRASQEAALATMLMQARQRGDLELVQRLEGSLTTSSCRVWALSDIHTDRPANMDWITNLGVDESYASDTLILAGDVSDDPKIMRATLSSLASTFKEIFFCPGNHDLWVHMTTKEARGGAATSLDVLEDLFQLCHELGIHTAPALSSGVIIVPILSWHHKSWDSEPELTCWTNVIPASKCVVDYFRCKWPQGLDGTCDTDSVARHFDTLNDRHGLLEDLVSNLRAQHPDAPCITFSHFVPRVELSPEKRYLFSPSLSKAIGSVHLKRRVDRLQPEVHVFGHSKLSKPRAARRRLCAGDYVQRLRAGGRTAVSSCSGSSRVSNRAPNSALWMGCYAGGGALPAGSLGLSTGARYSVAHRCNGRRISSWRAANTSACPHKGRDRRHVLAAGVRCGLVALLQAVPTRAIPHSRRSAVRCQPPDPAAGWRDRLGRSREARGLAAWPTLYTHSLGTRLADGHLSVTRIYFDTLW